MKKNPSLNDAQEAFNDLVTTGNSAVTYEEAFQMLDEADESKLADLASDYFNFDENGVKKGDSISFVVEGFEMMQLQGKQVEGVKLRDKDGKSWINAEKVLVSSCKRLTQLPAWIKVKYLDDKKGENGTYKNLIVKTFPIGK